MIKLKDIAEKVGVSRGTVSAVLGKSKLNIRVSPETAERIRSTASEMNYIPNFSAKVLNGKASKTIGVLIDSIEPSVHFRQLAAIEREAEAIGYRILIAEAHKNIDKQLLNYRILQQYGVDGIICHAYGVHEHFSPSDKVVIWGAASRKGFASVYYDILTGYSEAIKHLRDKGRKNIGLVLSDISAYDSLMARYLAFLKINPDAEKMIFILERCQQDPSKIRAETARAVNDFIIPGKIDAVIAENDVFAMAMIGELNMRGFRIPDDLAIVGQDNDLIGACFRPALTTIDSNIEGLAVTIVDTLRQLIENPSMERKAIAVPTKFIVRETS